jgi:hypothetical protein
MNADSADEYLSASFGPAYSTAEQEGAPEMLASTSCTASLNRLNPVNLDLTTRNTLMLFYSCNHNPIPSRNCYRACLDVRPKTDLPVKSLFRCCLHVHAMLFV